jgi:hypothetical protein
LNKLILTLTAFASVVMAVIAGEPIGPVLATPTTSDQDALILRILKAVETHDYRTLLIYTLEKPIISATKIHPMPSSNKI